jgi:hypothetical protein
MKALFIDRFPGVLLALAVSAGAAFGQAEFEVKFDGGAISNLKRVGDTIPTDYVGGRRLGDVAIRYRFGKADWQNAQSAGLARSEGAKFTTNSAGTEHTASFQAMVDDKPSLGIEMIYKVSNRDIVWTTKLQNLTDKPMEIGDLSVPISIGGRGGAGGGGARGTNNAAGGRRGGRGGATNAIASAAGGTNATTNVTAAAAGGGRGRGAAPAPVILKHSMVSGNGSYIYWMRQLNSAIVGPYLMFLPTGSTSLEYWETAQGGYRVFVHSTASGGAAKARGTNWRQPFTSGTLAPKGQKGDSETVSFKLRWVDTYDDVRQALVDEGKISAIEPEFPGQTKVEKLSSKGDTSIYKVQFAKLGENRVNVKYGDGQHMYLEFFSTEPLETVIKKRGAFLAKSQVRDTNKWYNGLVGAEWNMNSQVMLTPDNYDLIRGFRIYDVTCDDAGLGRPAFLAAKNAEFPVQKEVEAVDYHIKNFVWGGLQRTTEETRPYGVYGIPDWKTNRLSTNAQPKIGRVYDYPHVILLYYSMYRVAHHHPEIKTYLSAKDYLTRAYGTASAMFSRGGNNTGYYNELVIVDVINSLEAEGMKSEAATLRGFWERKVRNFINRDQDLFRSEYAFDSTGFESTHALARYAMERAEPNADPTNGFNLANAQKFLEKQMAANLFCRGTLEPVYYLLGSDIRGGGGNSYTLTYMSQMGGWAVLDYGLNYAKDPAMYLRSGYQSYLSAWALVNSGTPESNYGYWYPGIENDGGSGGGFEPAPFGQTWLGQPHHRGSWYYACEGDLGYSAGLRSAATMLADDPIFGRFCYLGDWKKVPGGSEIVPKDGVRRRVYAMLGKNKMQMALESDRFQAAKPITLREDLTEVRFTLETENPQAHVTKMSFVPPVTGTFNVRGDDGKITPVSVTAGQPAAMELPMPAGTRPHAFIISKGAATR